ncbi:hypothetical protein ES703_23541 [subsurface metagenome]
MGVSIGVGVGVGVGVTAGPGVGVGVTVGPGVGVGPPSTLPPPPQARVDASNKHVSMSPTNLLALILHPLSCRSQTATTGPPSGHMRNRVVTDSDFETPMMLLIVCRLIVYIPLALSQVFPLTGM